MPNFDRLSSTAHFASQATETYKRNFSDLWEEHIRRHSELTEVVENRLWKVSGTFYTVPNFRNMFVYKMNDGKLMLYSPMVLPESDMGFLEEQGEPSVRSAACLPSVDRQYHSLPVP